MKKSKCPCWFAMKKPKKKVKHKHIYNWCSENNMTTTACSKKYGETHAWKVCKCLRRKP